MTLRLLCIVVMSAVVLTGAAGSDIDPIVRDVLTRNLRFGVTELTDLEHDKIVKHSIETSAAGEVAVAGAARVHVPKSRFLERFRDIERFKRGPEVLQIGRFSSPPAMSDLAALTIDKVDFDPAGCRVRDCSVRLPADVIQRVAREIDPNAPDAQAKAAVLFKEVLLDQVKAHVSGGAGRMLQFDHNERPIRPMDEFAGILKNASAIGALVPGLPEHLANFPASRVEGAEDFLYWSKEKFGMGPFISITHVTIVCPSRQTCVATTRDVYSSHFLDASLSLTVAVDSVATPDAFYLVYANRTRANALKGWFSGLRQSIVERRARGSLDTNLRMLKNRLEKGEAVR
jgi:hypothetical protein